MAANHEMEAILKDVALLATDCLRQEKPSRSILELGQLYDSLVVQSRLLVSQEHPHQDKLPLFHKVSALQADLYRGILGVSSLLLDRLLPTASSNQTIQATQHQSALLLGLQSAFHALGSPTSTLPTIPTIPTNYPILQEWVEPLLFSALPESQRSTNLLTSFDPQSLEQEQDSLLQMAMTPIPAETSASQELSRQQSGLPEPSLVASLVSNKGEKEEGTTGSPGESTSVTFHPTGQLQTTQEKSQQQWYLSAESTVDYKDPYMTITHLVPVDANGCILSPSQPTDTAGDTAGVTATERDTANAKDTRASTASVSTLTLEVGTNGYPWWERISRVVQQLSEVAELQEALSSLFPADSSLHPQGEL